MEGEKALFGHSARRNGLFANVLHSVYRNEERADASFPARFDSVCSRQVTQGEYDSVTLGAREIVKRRRKIGAGEKNERAECAQRGALTEEI